MDNNQSEGKHGRVTKRSKKRQTTDSQKKSAKYDDVRDKSNTGITFPDSERNQDSAETNSAEAGSDGACGNVNSSEALSLNLALNMILNQKKKEVLESPEVLRLLQQASSNLC